MTPKSAWTRKSLERSAWAEEFKRDAPVSYATALRYAQEERLEVFVEKTDESGYLQWVIRVLDDPAFWMDAKPTKKAATELCRQMGWKII